MRWTISCEPWTRATRLAGRRHRRSMARWRPCPWLCRQPRWRPAGERPWLCSWTAQGPAEPWRTGTGRGSGRHALPCWQPWGVGQRGRRRFGQGLRRRCGRGMRWPARLPAWRLGGGGGWRSRRCWCCRWGTLAEPSRRRRPRVGPPSRVLSGSGLFPGAPPFWTRPACLRAEGGRRWRPACLWRPSGIAPLSQELAVEAVEAGQAVEAALLLAAPAAVVWRRSGRGSVWGGWRCLLAPPFPEGQCLQRLPPSASATARASPLEARLLPEEPAHRQDLRPDPWQDPAGEGPDTCPPGQDLGAAAQ